MRNISLDINARAVATSMGKNRNSANRRNQSLPHANIKVGIIHYVDDPNKWANIQLHRFDKGIPRILEHNHSVIFSVDIYFLLFLAIG
jgi:hypothetical protein